MRSFALLGLVLLVACGDDSTGSNDTTVGSGGASSASAGGDAVETVGAGGDGATAPQASVSVSASNSGASASNSTSGSGSSTGGGGGGDVVGSGGGGTGGSEPLCPAADCPEFGAVCDPDACGDQWPSCDDYVCITDDDLVPQQLVAGTTLIRTPPVTEQHPRCASSCSGMAWAMAFRKPIGFSCIRVVAPEPFVASVSLGAENSVACPQEENLGACGQSEATGYLQVGLPLGATTAGAIITVTATNDNPCFVDEPECDVGCNGEGG